MRKDSSIFFGVENSGWLRVTNLSNAKALRQGKCEDRNWMYDKNRDVLYISSNCDNLNGRGIDRFDMNSSSMTNIVHSTPHVVAGGQDMVISKSYFAWLQSSATEPNFVRIQSIRTNEIRVISDDLRSSPEWAKRVKPLLITPDAIVFDSKPFPIYSSLFRRSSPSSSTSSVLYTHGGSERQSFSAFHFAPHYATEYMFNQYLALVHNITTLSINYRSGIGFGTSFRLCDSCMSSGAAEYLDIRQAGRVLKGEIPFKFIDDTTPYTLSFETVGLWGGSYGGLNALQGITRDPELFSRGVAISPVFNWISTKRFVTDTGRPSYMFDTIASYQDIFRTLSTGPLGNVAGNPNFESEVLQRQHLAWTSSPASQLNNYSHKKNPLLIIQGDADEEVPFEETVAIVRALRKFGIDENTLVFPDETHCINAYRNQLVMWEAAASFLLSD